MKYFWIALLLIGKSISLQAQYNSSFDIHSLTDTLYNNLFSNKIEPKVDYYGSVLRNHDKTKVKEYDSLILVYARDYINIEITKLLSGKQFDIDSLYITNLKIDSFAFIMFNFDYEHKPIISLDKSGLVPKTKYNYDVKMPSFSSIDIGFNHPKDTSYYFNIIRRYVDYAYTENKDQYVRGLTKKEIDKLYLENTQDINKIEDPILKLLCLFQLELFMYQNNGTWTPYYFYNFRMKEIENKIYYLDTYMQSIVYYYIGKMLTNARAFEDYRYKYLYKSYYTTTKYNLNYKEFGVRSLTYLNFILNMNSQNTYYKTKCLNLLIATDELTMNNITDSVNIQLLKYINVIEHIISDNQFKNDSQTAFNIYIYAHYDLLRLLKYAQNNNIRLNERIASMCFNNIGNNLILWSSRYNYNLSVTYHALSLKYAFESPDLSHLFIKPIDDLANMLIFMKDYKNARVVIGKMLHYSDFIDAPNYTGNALVRLLYLYDKQEMNDSVLYTKKLLDSMLSNGQLDPHVSYLYAQALNAVGLSRNSPQLTKQANEISMSRQNDFTMEYSSIVKMEQEAKDEVNEFENKRNLEWKDYYIKEFEKNILKDTIYLRDKELLSKNEKLKRLNDNITLVKQQLKDTSQALSNASNRLISINKIRDSLIENNNTLIAISNRLSLDTAQKRREIANLNESIILSNESAEFWSKAFGISTVILAFALILLIASQKFRSGFVQKRLLYHQQKNDNSALVSNLNIMDLYLNGLIPNDKSEQELVNNLQDKLNDLKSYISAIFHYQRSTIVNSMKRKIPLNKEIDNIEKYVELSRYSYKKEIELKIDPALRKLSSNIKIPSNILQPIVENAIKHGFSNRDTNNIIEINLVNKGTNHILCIEDNGHGFNPNKLKKTSNLFVFLNNMFDFKRKKDIDEDQSVSLNDIVYYLLLLKIQLVTTIGFSLAKNIKNKDSGNGTIIELENIKL